MLLLLPLPPALLLALTVLLTGAADGFASSLGENVSRFVPLVGVLCVTTLSAGDLSSLIGLGTATMQDLADHTKLLLPTMAAALAAGLTVSCDSNFRMNLWNYGKEPQEVLPPLMEQCDAFFGTDDEYEKVLGMQLPQFAARDTAFRPDTAGYERASAEGAARFPRCRSIVFGLRIVFFVFYDMLT